MTNSSTPELAPTKPAAMRAVNIFTGFVFALWGGLLWMGIGLMKNMAYYQHAFGYPNASDIRFWIDAPAGMLALLLSAFAIFNFVTRSRILLAIVALLAIVPLFLYLIDLCFAAAA